MYIQCKIFLASTFFLGSLATLAEPSQTDLKQDGLHGAVRFVRIESSIAKNNSPRFILKSIHYNRQGYRTNLIFYGKNGSINSHLVFQYDSNKNKIKEELFNGASKIISKKSWKYDDSGRNTQAKLFSREGQLIHQTLWSYSAEGRVLEERFQSPARSIENKRIKFDYNDHGQKRSETFFDHKNTPYKKRTFFYSKDHRLIRKTLSEFSKTTLGKIKAVITENDLYDKGGKLIETTKFIAGTRFWKQWQYTYNKRGQKIQEDFFLKPREIESRWIYLIDPNNNNLLEQQYIKKGKTIFIKKYFDNQWRKNSAPLQPKNKQTESWSYYLKLDKQGNWIEKTASKLKAKQNKQEKIRNYYRIIEYY